MPVLAREASIHGRHRRGVLPRHGLPRRAHRRLDLPLGGGASRGRLAYGPAALPEEGSGGAGLRAGRVLRARRGGDDPGRERGLRHHPGGRRRPEGHVRAGERPHAAIRQVHVVARPRPRLRAPLSGGELAAVLVARQRRLADWHFLQRDAGWAESRRPWACSQRPTASSRSRSSSAPRLPDRERVVLLGARLMREGVLQQSSLSAADAYCTPAKQGGCSRSPLPSTNGASSWSRAAPRSASSRRISRWPGRATSPRTAPRVAAIGARVLARLEELA